jgi:hypothetical protein
MGPRKLGPTKDEKLKPNCQMAVEALDDSGAESNEQVNPTATLSLSCLQLYF